MNKPATGERPLDGPGDGRPANAMKRLPQGPVTLVMVLAVVILMVGLYANTLKGPFLFDDYPNILENPHIRMTGLSFHGLKEAAFQSIASNRPVANVTIALNYYFHQYRPAGYHAVNILIHVLAALFLFFLVKATVTIAQTRTTGPGILEGIDPSLAAFLATLLWAASPLCTQSVSYVIQRMNSMSAMFYILSMLCYVKARLGGGRTRLGLYAASLVSGILAVGSKEIAATLPFFILLYEWYFFQDLDTRWIRRNSPWLAGIAALILLLAVLFAGTHFLRNIRIAYFIREFTMTERVLTEFRVVIFYLTQILYPNPSRLNLDHDFAISHSLVDPVATLLSLAAIVALLVLAAATARKNRLLSFAILWFFGNLALESSFIGLEIIYEHRTYLPSMFVVFALAAAVLRYARPWWAGVAALCVAVGIFSFWTYQRNEVWADEMRLLQDCVRKAPGSPRTQTNLGLALMARGRTDDAIPYLTKALELSPGRPFLYKNLAEALMVKKEYEEALTYYRKGLALAQGTGMADRMPFYLGMGSALDRTGRHAEALEQYRLALKEDPRSDKAYILMGKSFADQGMLEEALAQLDEALRVNPANGEAYNSVGNILAQQGKADEAIRYYTESIRRAPGSATPHVNAAALYQAQGRTEEALRHYREAVRINPGSVNARSRLAGLFLERGELGKAIDQLQRIAELEPGNQEARNNLALLQERRNGIEAARSRVSQSLASDPGNARLQYQLGELSRMEGDFAGALESFRKALSLSPGNVQALRQMAYVYSLSGDHEGAVGCLKQIIVLDPANPDAYYNVACQYSLLGNAGESVRWLSKAVDKGFRNWDLLKKDTDLYNIRYTPFYKEIIKGK